MKSLEFEKVSVFEVRRELDRQHRKDDEIKCAVQRAPQIHAVLLDETSGWIADCRQTFGPSRWRASFRELPTASRISGGTWRGARNTSTR